MSSNKAIIVSDIPVIREVLNEKNSVLVKSCDFQFWVNAIQMLKNKKNREFIANNALKDFYKYTWLNRAKQVLKLKNYNN